jgi:spectrin alpha
VSNWEQLVEKARLRKQKLDESYFLHRFLADFRDLTSWINDIKTVISADELAKVPYSYKGIVSR